MQPTVGAATAGGSYTSAEQAMLQAVHDAVRALGLGQLSFVAGLFDRDGLLGYVEQILGIERERLALHRQSISVDRRPT